MYKKEFEIREHNGAVFSLAHDNKFIYSASADKFVTRWNPVEGVQDDFAIQCDSTVYKIFHLKLQPIIILGTSKGDLHIINTFFKEEIKFIKYHKVAIFEILCDEINNRMYVGDADGNLSVWCMSDWSLIITLPFDCGKIRSIIAPENSNLLFFGAQDGEIRVLDVQNFNLLTSFSAHKGGCLSLLYASLKNKVFFSCGKDGFVRVWNIEDFSEVFSFAAHYEAVYKIIFFKNKLISVSRDKTIKTWDLNTLDFDYKIDRKKGGHSHSVNDILNFKDKFFSSSDDKKIISWIPS